MELLNSQDIGSAFYHNKPIELKCIVSGKSVAPYAIPKTIRINCLIDSKTNCDYCDISENNIVSIKAINENILKFIDVPSNSFTRVIKDIFNISCKFTFNVIDVQNIERIFILPPTGKERYKTKLLPTSYYIGYGLDINTVYNMKGYTSINPINQTTTHVFTEATKLKSDIDGFILTQEKHNRLTKFNVLENTASAIFKHLERLYTYYAYNVTKIYDRFDLHLAIDLVFRSVLSFNFDNEFVHKGWVDAIIIGDTRCGKGAVAEKLASYFGLGEVVSGENCSIAGLTGGVQQLAGHWVITWGKIPLNDGGLVIIDEAFEIKPDEWSKLSRVRSEGIVEITKIQTQITNARTRLIFIANPINKTISNYSYGIQALQEGIKTPEDIARFDYALTVAHNEVPIEDINKHKDLVADIFDSSLENDLVLWAWSKKTNEIVFSPEAVKHVYEIAIILANTYSISVPLIQGENIRLKIAKLAICFASRVYSNLENGKYLFVDKHHVECVFIFLNMIYKKDSNGYYMLSKLQKEIDLDYTLKDFSEVDKYFSSYGKNRIDLCRCLMNATFIDSDALSEHMNKPKEIAREIISILLKNNCIIKKYNTQYIKAPAFTSWLKKQIITKEQI